MFSRTAKIRCMQNSISSLASLKSINSLKTFGLVQLIRRRLNKAEKHLFMWKCPKNTSSTAASWLMNLKLSKKYKTRFPDHSPMSECEFIIPMKYLYFVYYGSSVYSLITHKYKLELMNQISKAKKIWFSISYYSE